MFEMNVKSALRIAGKKFREAGMDSPDLEAGVLLSHVTGLDRAGLFREGDLNLTAEEQGRFFALVDRRLAGEPAAYLTGSKEFMSLDFFVNRHVLIPRPETELLVETALKFIPGRATVIDVGTGSGAVAVALAFFNKNAVVHAADCSPEALETARANVLKHGLGERVFLYQGDLLAPLYGKIGTGCADLITANLPYIEREGLSQLPREVRLYEPLLALDGGSGGLDLYRRLIPAARDFLKRGGVLLMEIGSSQGSKAKLLFNTRYWETDILKDLAGRDRLLAARLK